MTAERIALCGLLSPIILSTPRDGRVAANIAGIMAKYFATSFAMEKVVSDPLVIKSCFPKHC